MICMFHLYKYHQWCSNKFKRKAISKATSLSALRYDNSNVLVNQYAYTFKTTLGMSAETKMYGCIVHCTLIVRFKPQLLKYSCIWIPPIFCYLLVCCLSCHQMEWRALIVRFKYFFHILHYNLRLLRWISWKHNLIVAICEHKILFDLKQIPHLSSRAMVIYLNTMR